MSRIFGQPRLAALHALLVTCVLALTSVAAAQDARNPALDVAIAVFEPGVPTDLAVQRDLQVFPRIREIEARLLPFALREALVATGEWGVVRVVPKAEAGAELMLRTEIQVSDGERLALRVRANDATGRQWLDEVFSDQEIAASPHTGGTEHSIHAALFVRIATRLGELLSSLGDRDLAAIPEIALLRYGRELAPVAFGQYLAESKDGQFTVKSLPARDDPMVDRIRRVRETEYVIVDTVDERYQQLYAEISSVYALWTGYRRKSREYQEADARWVQERPSDLERGGFEALQRAYDGYKWTRLTAQEQDDMAVAFDNEVTPIINRMETRIAELEQWVDEKYLEWNRLLEELYGIETRLEE